jgi:hypothetical protein
MTAQRANRARAGNSSVLYEVTEPTCVGETRVHLWCLDGLSGFKASSAAKLRPTPMICTKLIESMDMFLYEDGNPVAPMN